VGWLLNIKAAEFGKFLFGEVWNLVVAKSVGLWRVLVPFIDELIAVRPKTEAHVPFFNVIVVFAVLGNIVHKLECVDIFNGRDDTNECESSEFEHIDR
jgi:hypothetical protein